MAEVSNHLPSVVARISPIALCLQLGAIFFFAMMAAILVSIVSFCVSTLPDYRRRAALDLYGEQERAFDTVEAICVAIFTIEYLGRLITITAVPSDREVAYVAHFGWVSVADKPVPLAWPRTVPHFLKVLRVSGGKFLRFLFKPLNVVDLVAIAPYYVNLVSPVDVGGSLTILRVLRLARVLRLFKMSRRMEGVQILASTMYTAMDALGFLAFFLLLAIILFGSIIFFCEAGEYNRVTGEFERPSVIGNSMEVSPFKSIPHAFWWTIVTMTTVGYGDMVPTTDAGRALGSFIMLSGILVLALPITVVGSAFTEEYTKFKERRLAALLDEQDRDAAVVDAAAGVQEDDYPPGPHGSGSSDADTFPVRSLSPPPPLSIVDHDRQGCEETMSRSQEQLRQDGGRPSLLTGGLGGSKRRGTGGTDASSAQVGLDVVNIELPSMASSHTAGAGIDDSRKELIQPPAALAPLRSSSSARSLTGTGTGTGAGGSSIMNASAAQGAAAAPSRTGQARAQVASSGRTPRPSVVGQGLSDAATRELEFLIAMRSSDKKRFSDAVALEAAVRSGRVVPSRTNSDAGEDGTNSPPRTARSRSSKPGAWDPPPAAGAGSAPLLDDLSQQLSNRLGLSKLIASTAQTEASVEVLQRTVAAQASELAALRADNAFMKDALTELVATARAQGKARLVV